jgi:hypothetical protein
MKQYVLPGWFLWTAVAFLSLTYLPLIASEGTLDAFGREDGIYENLTALYLLMTSVIFGVAFFRFRKSSWLLRLSYVGLALFFFLGAGEEISWGERIFHWDDKNYIRGVNVQGELTIHNLKYFQGEDALIPVSASQLFTLFAFVFGVMIPLACRLSPRVASFVTSRFPVMPLAPGLLVVATYVLQKAMLRLLPLLPGLYKHPSMPIPQGVHEIREHGYTVALLLAAALYYVARKKEIETEAGQDAPLTQASPATSMPLRPGNAGDNTR